MTQRDIENDGNSLDDSLVILDKALQFLVESYDIGEVKRYRDQAESVRLYAKRQGYAEAQNKAAEYKIWAERRLGELLKETGRGPGERDNIERYQHVTFEPPPKLSALGITKMQSSRWKRAAQIPEPELKAHIAARLGTDRELTSVSVLRLAQRLASENAETVPIEGKYRVFYADPPWQYGNVMPEYMGVQDDHYELLSMTKLKELSVKEAAEENAVLFLWVTSPMLEDAFGLIRAWGFEYKASFVWDKVKHNMGHYNSVRHEFLLVCTRGSCVPDVKKLYDSVVSVAREEHSAKPAIFREMIDTLYSKGARIELFARERIDGWESWGSEIS